LAVVALVGALLVVGGAPAPAGADGNEAPGAPAAFRELSAGGSHTCAILFDGTVKCWGLNDKGQLGLGDTANRGDGPGEMGDDLPTVDLGTGRTATAISAGTNHTCALLDNGSVKCWGFNQTGELGLGDTASRGDGAGEMGDDLPAVDLGTGRTAVAVSAGQQYTCALLDDGSVKCWGSNFSGKLGLGDTANRGDGAGEMGDDLPAVELGTGRTATAVSAGGFHACALLDNGTMKCWGAGGAGALGQGSSATLGDGAGEMGDNLLAIALGTGRTATAISAGTDHTCALLDNGSVKCWGQSNLGQLGLGINTSVGRVPGQMGDALAAVALGTGRTAVAVRTKFNHTCALLDDGSVKCWGWNVIGQLGLGDTDDRGEAPGDMGDSLPAVALGTGRTVVAVTTGITHTCARLDDGSLKCWGQANSGQSGLGDTQTRGDGPGEMGDDLPATQLLTPAPAMTVTLTSDESSVESGATVHTHATITNTGNVGLTGLTVPTSGCESPPAMLAPGANTVVDCTYVTTPRDIPTHAASAAADSDQTSLVTSNVVDVAVTIPAGQALVKGQVTAVLFGNGVSGALVAGLDPTDYTAVGLDLTAADGTYAMLVPAGSLMVYVLDPAGGHVPAFTQNTPMMLAGGSTTTVSPQLNRALGGIEGRITDASSGDGIATGLAVSTNARTGQISLGAATDGFGFYVIRNLRAVSHLVTLVDLSGAHSVQYFGGTRQPAGATRVDVVGDALQVIGTTALAAQTAPSGTAHLQGTVTTSGGDPLPGVAVVALNASNFEFEAGAITDGSGAYDIPVDPGSYLLGFADTAGTAQFEWHADQPASGVGSATPVATAVGTPGVVDAALDPSRGTISGTVTEDGSSDPLANVWVVAIDATGVVGVAKTAVDGTYSISGVPVGSVRVRFYDLTGAHVPEYYDDHAGPDGGYSVADLLAVAGGTTATADAGLAPSG
jgi:alpha-tubulin suppressor-like RCC1 family protein